MSRELSKWRYLGNDNNRDVVATDNMLYMHCRLTALLMTFSDLQRLLQHLSAGTLIGTLTLQQLLRQ